MGGDIFNSSGIRILEEYGAILCIQSLIAFVLIEIEPKSSEQEFLLNPKVLNRNFYQQGDGHTLHIDWLVSIW